MITGLYFFFRVLFYYIFRVFFGFKVYGSEVVPEIGGVIIAANHVSYLDPPVLGLALKRKAVFIAKKELFTLPVIGCLIRRLCIPVDREHPKPSTIKEALKRLRNGEVVVIFPEGGINLNGSFKDAKRGIGLISYMSNVPVIPVFIKGTHKALPVGTWFPRLAKIEVFFGNPLKLEEYEDEKDFQERICRDIMDRIKELGK